LPSLAFSNLNRAATADRPLSIEIRAKPAVRVVGGLARNVGAHDDIANAVAGALVMAMQRGLAMPTHRLQTRALGSDYDPLATPQEQAVARAREEASFAAGYFTGPGWAPTWHGDEFAEQQTHAIE